MEPDVACRGEGERGGGGVCTSDDADEGFSGSRLNFRHSEEKCWPSQVKCCAHPVKQRAAAAGGDGWGACVGNGCAQASLLSSLTKCVTVVFQFGSNVLSRSV